MSITSQGSDDRGVGASVLRAHRLPVRPEYVGAKAYGAPQLDVAVRLNTNENPYPVPADVATAVAESLAAVVPSLNRYPDRDAIELRTALARYVTDTAGNDQEFGPESLWAANGSNEILQQLLQLFAGPSRTALGCEPTYSMHRLIAQATHTQYRVVERSSAAAGFAIDVAATIRAIHEDPPAVVFICSPNNPTGTATPLDDIRSIYDAVVTHDIGIVIVDEAYAEFSSAPSAITLLDGRPRLVVTRTLSKAFAFAGGRLGYCVAHPDVIAEILKVRLPYHLSSLTQAAAVAATAHAPSLQAHVEALRGERDRIVHTLTGWGYAVVPSDANFVMFGRFPDSHLAWEALLAEGVLVRDVGLDSWLRVTAGTTEETTAFLDAVARENYSRLPDLPRQ